MKRRQLHFRLTEREYRFLAEAALAADEPMATILRRLVREAIAIQARSLRGDGTNAVPNLLRREGA